MACRTVSAPGSGGNRSSESEPWKNWKQVSDAAAADSELFGDNGGFNTALIRAVVVVVIVVEETMDGDGFVEFGSLVCESVA